MLIDHFRKLLLTAFALFISSFSYLTQAHAEVPLGTPEAHWKGKFGPAFSWPIIAIHVSLLPDGRVFSFGTDDSGLLRGYTHVIWDPVSGEQAVYPNSIKTNIFCSGVALIPGTGQALIIGSNSDVNTFDYKTNSLSSLGGITERRWYPTVLVLANGEIAILGGRDHTIDTKAPQTASIPQIFNPATGLFRQLNGAQSDYAYGWRGSNWNYPQAFQAPNGKIFIVGHAILDRNMFWMDPTGEGSVDFASAERLATGSPGHSSVMFHPNKILAMREKAEVNVIDISPENLKPFVTKTSSLSQERIWANLTVLPTGDVLATGGSAVANELVDVATHAEIWNPKTGLWTQGDNATKPRLYHSTALLLPDASVLTAGGGSPGPVSNFNAEIYYPPYLYSKTGKPLPRPEIIRAPSKITWKKWYPVQFSGKSDIRRAVMVRTGALTHTFNAEQRLVPLKMHQRDSSSLRFKVHFDRNSATPGFYMLFLIDKNGTPSVAKIIDLS